jgi:hypothetical protein
MLAMSMESTTRTFNALFTRALIGISTLNNLFSSVLSPINIIYNNTINKLVPYSVASSLKVKRFRIGPLSPSFRFSSGDTYVISRHSVIIWAGVSGTITTLYFLRIMSRFPFVFSMSAINSPIFSNASSLSASFYKHYFSSIL